jgi:hypothetical protein
LLCLECLSVNAVTQRTDKAQAAQKLRRLQFCQLCEASNSARVGILPRLQNQGPSVASVRYLLQLPVTNWLRQVAMASPSALVGRVCALCHGFEHSQNGGLGPLIGPFKLPPRSHHHGGNTAYVHRMCAVWCPEVMHTQIILDFEFMQIHA